jgi:hypothetical protein
MPVALHDPQIVAPQDERRRLMRRTMSYALALVLLAFALAPSAHAQTQVWGVWHCTSDYCTWATAPNMTTFDTQNHWILDRGNGAPSVNLVNLSFVHPLKLMNLTTDSGDTNGVPNGMTSAVVSYFTSKGIRVILSIGGQTYTTAWDQALSTNPTQLGINAANLATSLGVGIEIDYENGSSPNLSGLQAFVSAYRSVVPYDATGANPAARLTIDLGAGDQYLSALASYATANWLQDANPVLDYANAMVVHAKTNVSAYEKDWSEHINGYPTLNVGPLAPARLTGSFFLVSSQPAANCVGPYSSTDQSAAKSYVKTVAPGGQGTTAGMLGLMWWAAGCQGTTTACTFPPNTCQAGIGGGATDYAIPVPMPALRQQ